MDRFEKLQYLIIQSSKRFLSQAKDFRNYWSKLVIVSPKTYINVSVCFLLLPFSDFSRHALEESIVYSSFSILMNIFFVRFNFRYMMK